MLADGEITEAEVDNATGRIKGVLSDETEFVTDGPIERSQSDDELLRDNVEDLSFVTPTSNFFLELLPLLLFFAMIVGFFLFMQRRAQGQMSGIMSIGRSKAKTYSTERPGTTFEDVAGYDGVKQEITEVVDFLKHPDKFSEIGARIPKGILLVGPPGTGKTLIARAVAGEAGVPFLSVTGSDFMEMFVGVGASRVRDLFQSARKMGRAIIFIDEIDSIGRKRGAGLGGGHDEREQTLNQMLAEMDGFEPTEGIVMMAASSRPPGRRAASRPRRSQADPESSRQGQADGPRRRPRRRRPRCPGYERRRLGEPRQRSRVVRSARWRIRRRNAALRNGARPSTHGPEARVDGLVR